MYKILAKTRIFGKKVIYMPSCHSTNEIAAQLVSKGDAIEGMLVITDNQTNGMGQSKNNWESDPYKNLTFSLILAPNFLEITNQFFLSVAFVLGIRNALSKIVEEGHLKCKWPNDIILNERKVCGILISNYLQNNLLQNSIVGIGLNVNQGNFDNSNATSIYLETNQISDLQSILESLVREIEIKYDLLRLGKFEQLKVEYENVLYRINEQHNFLTNKKTIHGKIIGISNSGKLKIETENNIEFFGNKEVTYLE